MKSKFLFISMMLILVIGIGAASAADISDASDSNSDTSIASPVDSVDGDGFDYAGDSIDMNVSDSSDILGVGEEDDVIGTGVFDSIVFSDAVDGVITWDTMDYGRYSKFGYADNTIKLDILDANGEHIEITNYKDWEFEYDGFPADKNWEDYGDVMEYVTESYNDVGEIPISEIMYLVGLYDDDGDLLYDEYVKTGNHTLTVYNKDKSFSQSVEIVMVQLLPDIVFKDAVDGVITFNQIEAAPWNPSQKDYNLYGYMYNAINFDILDVNGKRVTVTDFSDWHIEYDGHSGEGDDEYADYIEALFSYYNDGESICLYSYMYPAGLYDKNTYSVYLDEYCKIGNHTLTIYSDDGTYNNSVKIVMNEPKDVTAKVSIKDLITVDVTTDDGPGNFTVYVADEAVATGTVDANGTGSVSFEKIYGKNTLKVILDGATAKGLKYETTIDVIMMVPGSFSDLKDKIDNAVDVLDLPYDFKLTPEEAELYKNGVLIEKNITINANGFTINGTSVDGTSARIFDTANYVTLTINNANLVDGGVSGVNGGALRATPYAHLILNNVTITDNFGNSAGGAINLNANGALTATDVTFKNNNCNSRGGAIFANSNTNLNLTNVVFDSNTAKSNGGNLFVGSNSNVIIENATFRNFYIKADNVAGGAIYVESNSNVAISDSLFENITVEMANSGRWYRPNENNGGVIHCDDTVILNVTGSTFKNNRNINTKSDAISRGIIYSTGSNAYSYITDCVFINNSAQQSGAIYTRNADIIGCLFVNNSGTDDYPEIYYEGSGKGTISHNVFLDDNTAIRIRNNADNVVETTNWWASNNPGDLVRIENTYVAPNKYIVMSVYNEGNTAYATLTRNSIGDFIENPELVPVRTAIFEASQTTSADTVDAVASAEVTDSQVNITIDGETMTLFMASGNITNIQVVSVENTNVGADGKVYFVLTGDNGPVDGKLTVISNDKACEVEVSNGSAIAEFGSDFDAGEYDIYYIYEGGANYAATNTKTKAEQKLVVSKNDVTITIDRVKNIVTFNVTGENGIIPTGTINATVGDINKVFTLSNGIASYNYGLDLGQGVYDVNVAYSGDKNNNEGSLVTTFEILKCDVVITFTNVTNTLTFNVTGTDGLIATGKIIVTLGNSTQTLTLNSNGLASYDFGKVLPAGEFNLIVNYTGDDYYSPGLMEDTFEIVKITPTIELTIDNINITQGQNTHVVIKVIGDENIATGYVKLMAGDQQLYRSSLYNGARETNLGSNLKAGIYNITVIYEGDGYYYATEYLHNETLNVLPKITIKAPSEVYSEQAPLIITIDPVDVNGTLIVKMDGVELFFDEIESGSLYLTLSNLEEGEHTFEAYYGGNDKYLPCSATVTTTVSYPELPQWAQQGYDYTNGGQSPYIRLNEVIELWNYTADKGSSTNDVATLLIDAEGNIYVAYNRKVTSLYADGSERWINTNGRWGGEAIDAHGYMITPQSGNAFNYLRISDGVCPNTWGYFYYGSSSYAPVIGPDGVIYVSYEYSYPYSGSYYDPTQVWGDRRWIGLVDWNGNGYDYRGTGNSLVRIEGEGLPYGTQPHVAPVTLDNLGNLWHTSTSGLRGVIISSNTVVFENANIGTTGRPVVDANNIVYVFGGEDQIFAVNAKGILWNTTVTDGSGNTMVVGKDSEYILSVNSEGVLYKYDVTDGKETKIYDFETTVSTALMTDANGVIYVGDDDGTFWALTDDGTLLWTFDAGSAITARPVMDKNGVIYIYTADQVLYALGNHKDDSTISLEVGDTTTVEGLTAVATVNENATGDVVFTLSNGESYKVKIVDGIATLIVTEILAGDYNITAKYTGNYAFNGNETSSSFTVTKVNSTIEIAVPIIYVDTNGTINITIENATGDVLVQVTGLEDKVIALNEGIATYTLPLLEEGKYNIAVIYDGDAKYFNSTATSEFEVVKYDAELSLTIDDSVITVSINDNATGNVIVTIGDISFVKDAQNLAPIDAANYLNKGTYPVTVNYAGDDIFAGENLNGTVTVKAATIIVAPDVSVAYKDPNGEFVATVINQQGKPLVVNVDVIFNGEEYALRTDSNGRISIPIGNLTPGKYAAEISFKGSKNYRAANASALVTVTKSSTVISAPDVSVAYKDPTAELVATITNEHGKPLAVNLNVNFNGKDYTLRTDSDGRISLPIGNLTPGKYSATISYKGSSNYRASSTTALVTVTKSGTVIVAPDVSIEYKDSTGELVATITNEHGKPLVVNLNVNLNGKDYTVRTDSDGRMSLPIGTLASGNHVATISYKGSKNYEASSATAKVVVNKAATVISAQDVSIAYKDSGAELVATIVSEHNNKALIVDVTVNLNGKNYVVRTDSNGRLSIPIDTLSPGNYTATIIFKGSKNYAASTTTAQVVVRKAATTLSAQDVSIAYKDPNGALVATIVSEHGKTLDVSLNVNLNGKDYTLRTGSDGTMSLPIDTLTPGNYTATISYKGSKNYEASSVTAQVTVTKSDTMISAQDVTVASADSAGALVATVTNQHGKTLVVNVKVNLDGKTTTVKTDSNGQISVPNNELKPGTYDATISYNGSGNYNGSTATARITVI